MRLRMREAAVVVVVAMEVEKGWRLNVVVVRGGTRRREKGRSLVGSTGAARRGVG